MPELRQPGTGGARGRWGVAMPVLTAGAALAVWTAASARLPPVLLPSPVEVLEASWAARASLAEATLTTARAAIGGLAIAGVAGMAGAIAFQRSRWLEVALYPYALLIQTLPIVAIAPLLVVWLGYGLPVAAAAAAIAAFFPVLTGASLGLSSVSTAQVEAAPSVRGIVEPGAGEAAPARRPATPARWAAHRGRSRGHRRHRRRVRRLQRLPQEPRLRRACAAHAARRRA